MWTNPDGSPRIVIDRALPAGGITLSPGTVINTYPNTRKRDGKQDPDFDVNVEVPADVADAVIAHQRAVRVAAAPEQATLESVVH